MAAFKDPGRPLSLGEAVGMLRDLGLPVGRATVNRWIQDGTLPALRPGPRKHVRIKIEDVRAVAERRAAR